MAPAKIRVIIVGAGIVGASLAFHFARRGAAVHMVEGSAAGSGVTSRAFGWVNIINIVPGPANYRLVQEALAEYARLQTDLPAVFAAARPGSLFWLASAAETEAFAAAHRMAGTDVELVDAATIAAWEPNLREPPACAIFSPRDLALDPAKLARDLIDAAGVTATFGRKVESLILSGNTISGVRLADDGVIEADLVILAAGTAVDHLTENLGFRTGVEASPSIILRYNCAEPVLNRILRGPGLEIRQSADNRLHVAKGYIDDHEENMPERVGQRILKIMHERLRLPEGVSLVEAAAGYRPFFSDGMPRLGFLPGVEGAYAAVGHPGVILAPVLGRLAADHVLEGRRSTLIPPAGLI